jgi:hypothetical protein
MVLCGAILRHAAGQPCALPTHLGRCKHAAEGNRWTRCQCPIWIQGSIGGETIRRSLNTSNWTAASSIAHQWQSSGRIGVLKPELPTVADAVDQFLEEAAVRNLAATTIKKRRELLVGKLVPFCTQRGHRQLRDLTVERLREFRRGWQPGRSWGSDSTAPASSR